MILRKVSSIKQGALIVLYKKPWLVLECRPFTDDGTWELHVTNNIERHRFTLFLPYDDSVEVLPPAEFKSL